MKTVRQCFLLPGIMAMGLLFFALESLACPRIQPLIVQPNPFCLDCGAMAHVFVAPPAEDEWPWDPAHTWSYEIKNAAGAIITNGLANEPAGLIIASGMLEGPGEYWIRAAAKGKDPDSGATAWGPTNDWVAFVALKVELNIADTADEADDVVCVNGSVNVKARLTGPAGVSITVAFSTDPSEKATVSPASTNMTVGTDYDLTLTGRQASGAANDTDLIATIGECECATEDFTVCKVEIKDGADETKAPGKFACVGNTINFQAKITPALSGAYDWKITEGHKRAEIDGADNTKVVTNKALEASKHLDDVKIKLKFKPDGKPDWCSPVFHEFTVLKVELKEISFSGTKYHTIKKDDGSQDYTAPHWQDNSLPLDGDADDAGDKKYPISFTRDTKMKVSAKWRIESANPGVTIKVKGDGPGNLDFPDTISTISGNDMTITDIECSNPFVNEVDFFNTMSIAWSFSVDGGSTWCPAGTSANQTYITLGDPLTTVYHTLAHLGCKNADGQTTADGVADSIYAEFTDQEVRRVSDNKQMTYWINGLIGARTVGDILKSSDANGNCEAWSALFRDCLRVQGLTVDRIEVTPQSPDAGFLVNDWKFGKHIRTGPNGLRNTDLTGDDYPIFDKGNGLPHTVCIQAGVNLITTAAGDDVSAGGTINTGPDGICNTSQAGNDVQIITVGNGAPNTVCITPGPNSVIDSTPAGDDILSGNMVLTGPDGICQTALGGDDVHVIAVGNGQPNAVCINAGLNLITTPAGDDVVNGAEITTGLNGKCETAKAGNDIQMIPVGQGHPDTPCIGPGSDGTLNSTKQGDDTDQDGVFAGTAYPYWTVFDAMDQEGIPGQGNPNPISDFDRHYITRYNNQYYDPSYGTSKVTGADIDKSYEDINIAAFAIPDGMTSGGLKCRINNISPNSPCELNYQIKNN